MEEKPPPSDMEMTDLTELCLSASAIAPAATGTRGVEAQKELVYSIPPPSTKREDRMGRVCATVQSMPPMTPAVDPLPEHERTCTVMIIAPLATP